MSQRNARMALDAAPMVDQRTRIMFANAHAKPGRVHARVPGTSTGSPLLSPQGGGQRGRGAGRTHRTRRHKAGPLILAGAAVVGFCCLAGVWAPRVAHAQASTASPSDGENNNEAAEADAAQPEARPPSTRMGLVPPRVLERAEADYPTGYEAMGIVGAVELGLLVDAEGQVAEVEVLGSAGDAFDQAAIAALRRFVFAPATRDGQPIPARIRYRYVFMPDPQAQTQAQAQAQGQSSSGSDTGSDASQTREAQSPLPQDGSDARAASSRVSPSGDSTGAASRGLAESPGAVLELILEDTSGKPLQGADALLSFVGAAEASASADAAQGETSDEAAAGTDASGATDAPVQSAITDEQGRARFVVAMDGRYRVDVVADGYEGFAQEERLMRGEAVAVRYRIKKSAPGAAYRAVAEIDPPAREVVRRTLRQDEFVRIPGTRGDPLRAIELLPGIARPPFSAGILIVRGAAPGDSEFFLEGASIPLVYHFGGFTSVFNGRLLDRFDFFPGNFGVRYGRRVGGILEINIKDDQPTRTNGYVDINLIDASVLLSVPIGEKFSISLAGRRSYVDAVFESLAPSSIGVVSAPVYWDYQGVATYRPTSKDVIQLFGYGSSDRLRLLFSEPSDQDFAFRNNFNFTTSFHRVDLRWKRKINAKVDQEISATVGPNNIAFSIGPDLNLDLDVLQIYSRGEWRAKVHPKLTLTGGWDVFAARFHIVYRGGPPGQSEGNPGTSPLSTSTQTGADVSDVALRPGLYVEADYRPIDLLQFVVGLRADYFGEIERWTVDPRLSTILSVREDTRLKIGVGLFSQAPEFQESADWAFGNPALKPLRAVHLGAGIEYDVMTGVTVGLEGYYKHLYNRVVSTEDGRAPSFINDGIGRIYGLEVSGRIRPGNGPFLGILSYTVSRSERNDRGEGWRLFDFDQTHILNMAGVYQLPKGWEVGLRFAFISGNPQTPITGAFYDVSSDLFVPINGRVNSERSSYYHRLDLRVEKKWTFQRWALATYLDVQNVYNRQTEEGVSYNFNYTEQEPLRGLPILPSIGLRGEF